MHALTPPPLLPYVRLQAVAEAKCGGDIGSLVIKAPLVRREWKFIVMSVYRVESLPVMDNSFGMGKVGTKAYFKLEFAGGRPLITPVVSAFGHTRSEMNVRFNYQLWYPVSIPSMTQVIKVSLWHDNTSTPGPDNDELIGQFVVKMDKFMGKETSPTWFNIYGTQVLNPVRTSERLKAVAHTISTSVNTTVAGAVDYATLYNNVPDRASSFKGRCLVRFQIKENRPEKHKTTEIIPFKLKIHKMLNRENEPTTKLYVLRAFIVSGNNLPKFMHVSAGSLATAMTGVQRYQKLRVLVTIGAVELSTKFARYENGSCGWNELLETDPFELPHDKAQLPDIFVYLMNHANQPVCFARVKPVITVKDNVTKKIDSHLLQFSQPARWYVLQEDKVSEPLGAVSIVVIIAVLFLFLALRIF